MHNHRLLHIGLTSVSLAIAVFLTWLAYVPGLSGTFLFDDFANLPILGQMGPIDNWAALWRYLTAGNADPTGRPLSLLSFLIDARDWPAHPYPFIRTNVVLHLINGTLLAALLMRLGRFLHPLATDISQGNAPIRRVDLAAILGAALWMLHPLLVSTTLYIVQREAMLPATFTLIGLLLWLHGRSQLQAGHHLGGPLWIALGLGGCTLLAVLSKANGILLPALALLIDAIILAPHSLGREWRIYRRMMCLLAWLPTSLLASYLLYQGWTGITFGISSTRPWTLAQRLLSEPRVLIDYLTLLWLPRPFTSGLFNDQVQASTSLWSPAGTLPALLAIAALIAGSWWLRRKAPAMALAVLFYFVGHSLESSSIALELYFEHRNYLPSMLMFWPLAMWLCSAQRSVRSREPKLARSLKVLLAAILVLGLAVMTHARAQLWGDTHGQALLWAKLNPGSARAQAHAARAEVAAGQPDRATARLQRSFTQSPTDILLALNLFSAECQSGNVAATTLVNIASALATARKAGGELSGWFGRAIQQTEHPPCPQLNLTTLAFMAAAAQTNPLFAQSSERRQGMYFIQGRIALTSNKPDLALLHFNQALEQQVRIGFTLRQSALLGAEGYPIQGLAHLDYYREIRGNEYRPPLGMPRVHDFILKRQLYWQGELDQLRVNLEEDMTKIGRAHV